MSVTMQTQSSSTQQTAKGILEALWDDSGICSWCFQRRRRYYTEYEESVAEHLTGKNMSALECRGHEVTDDGTLLVDSTATSDADPSTYREVVPPRTDEYGSPVERPKALNVCECGVVDYDPSDDRSTRELHECVDNISERLEGEFEFSTEAAHRTVSKLRERDEFGGRDKDVLRLAIKFGRKYA